MSDGSSQAYLDIAPTHSAMAFMWEACRPQFSIDGGPALMGRWKQNMVPVAPGRHHVEVWCPYTIYPTAGQVGIDVDVAPGGVTRVDWKAPGAAFMKGKIGASAGVMPTDPAAYQPPVLAGAQAQAPVAAGPPPAGWHPDPVGRHEHRYWDGTAWTEHVSNAGTAGVDPLAGA